MPVDSLAHLAYNCWVSHLDVKSLLGLAKMNLFYIKNRFLHHVLVSAFALKFGHKTIWLKCENGRPATVEHCNQFIGIVGTTQCLLFLWLFGAKISNLVVDGDCNPAIDFYINKIDFL